jgi:hypothetical protein
MGRPVFLSHDISYDTSKAISDARGFPSCIAKERRHFFAGGLGQSAIQGGEGNSLSPRQFQVRGSVHRKAAGARDAQNASLVRSVIDSDWQPRKGLQKSRRIGLANPLPALVDDQNVADLEPPEAGHDPFLGSDPSEGQGCGWTIFIQKRPAGCDGSVQYESY